MEALQLKEGKAGFYTDKEGVQHSIPKKQTRYEKFGMPAPSTMTITPEDEKVTKDLLAGDRKEILIRYVRQPSVVQIHKVKHKIASGRNAGAEVERTVEKIAKGMPLAVLVAFKHDDKVYVGWSRRHSPKEDVDDETNEKVLVETEPLIFTKEDAVRVAILRGLADKLVINTKTIRMASLKPLPKDVEKELPSFIGRVIRYFGEKPVNLDSSPVIAL